MPLVNRRKRRQERNIEVRKTFEKLSVAAADLPIVPMEALTRARWDMHPNQPVLSKVIFAGGVLSFREDCTHYVYSPTFYAPVWRAMSDILERKE